MSTSLEVSRPRRTSRARVNPRAWERFRRNLATALAALASDQYLIVAAKKGHRFVQFARSESTGGALELRAEAVSNNYLEETERLTKKQERALASLGWNPPTHKDDEPHVPKGSPNFYRDFAAPLTCEAIARLAVRTLSEVFRVRHPGQLEYRSFERTGTTELLFPTLGIDRERPPRKVAPPDEQSFQDARGAVLRAVREASKIESLEYDEDGDIPVSYGKAQLFVHVHEKPRYARVFSPIVDEVELSERLLRRINELNARATLVRFVLANGRIWVSSDVFAHPLMPKHVVHACHVVGDVANDLRESLQLEFCERNAVPMPNANALPN